MPHSNINTTIDSSIHKRHKKAPSLPQSLQNSVKKKSLGERLDTNETLLKKINKKFDDIFKDRKISLHNFPIDPNNLKSLKNYDLKKAKHNSSKKKMSNKEKYSEKMKNLIQKIIKEKKNYSEESDSSATFQLTGGSKAKERYANSSSLNSSDITESDKMSKDDQALTMKKEITYDVLPEEKENLEETFICKSGSFRDSFSHLNQRITS